MPPISRRTLLTAVPRALTLAASSCSTVQVDDIWSEAAWICQVISPPVFLAVTWDISQLGAHAGGQVDVTQVIRGAIDDCAHSGGGRVLIPAGV